MKLIILVILALTLIEVSAEMYAPALPYVKTFFNTDIVTVQFSISLYMMGLAFASLIYGMLSDIYGRRVVFLNGLCIFTLGSFICCFADTSYDITTLLIARLIQGIGGGAALTLGYASISDMYSGNILSKAISRINMVVTITPSVSPIIGSFIITHYSWEKIFIFIFIYALIVFVLFILFFQDPMLNEERATISIFQFYHSYLEVLKNSRFLNLALIEAGSLAWFWGNATNAPIIFMQSMQLNVTEYTYYISLLSISYLIGTMINHLYLNKIGSNNLLKIGIVIPFASNVLMLLVCYYVPMTPKILLAFWVPSNIALALILNNTVSSALDSLSKTSRARGSASIIFMHLLLGSICIYFMGKFYNDTMLPINIINIICSGGALSIYILTKKRCKII